MSENAHAASSSVATERMRSMQPGGNFRHAPPFAVTPPPRQKSESPFTQWTLEEIPHILDISANDRILVPGV